MPVDRRNRAAISSDWHKRSGRLVRELRFRDYECALNFAGLIGQVDDFGHHADLCIRHDLDGRLNLTIRNLNHGGITQQEIRLARKLDEAITEHYDYAYGNNPTTARDLVRLRAKRHAVLTLPVSATNAQP